MKSEDYETFKSTIREYWQNNYHFAVNDYRNLIKRFKEKNTHTNIEFFTILPEVEDCYWGVIRGKDESVCITEQFYQKIIKKMQKSETNCLQILSKKDHQFFALFKRQHTDDGNFHIFGIMEITDIIKV